MRLRDTLNSDGAIFNLARRIWYGLGLPKPHPPLTEFRHDPAMAAQLGRQPSGEIARLFSAHRGRPIGKWVHYFGVYEEYLQKYRNKPFTMLEIGVSGGGSLELWREYFGQDARIFGIDIDPECAHRVSPPNQVRIGSQDDPKFLETVIAEMGPPDIILDDGSHVARHQITSFNVLFPHLKTGGLYIVEDVHTAYWPEFYDLTFWRTRTFIKFVHRLIDDMHGWYHYRSKKTDAMQEISAIHVHDSIVVIEKNQRARPNQIVAPIDGEGVPIPPGSAN
jgi:cephalosporin hydroxylase